MKRIAVALALLAAACAGTSEPQISPAPATPSPTTAAPRIATTVVAVSVATVWSAPTASRPVDTPALSAPAKPQSWVDAMTNSDKLDLIGRIETQALYGTPVRVVQEQGEWSKVVIPSQPSGKNAGGYPGWIPTTQLRASQTREGPRVVVTSRTASISGPESVELSYATTLPLVRDEGTEVVVATPDDKTARVNAQDVRIEFPKSPSGADVIREATKFVGLPYLWGGTSGFGYDCSGLTYSVYRALGVTIARDTQDQMKDGRGVSLSDIRPGDLLFVADRRGEIVHNAIYYGVRDGIPSIVESPRTGAAVRIAPLSAHAYVAARRILGM